MTEVGQYLLDHSTVPIVPKGRDEYVRLEQKYTLGFGGTVMPPSASVRKIRAQWYLDKDEIGNDIVKYSIDIKWRKHMPWLVRHMTSDQITHRSRDFSLSSTVLLAEELRRRVAIATESQKALERIALSPKQSEQVLRDIIEPTIDALHYDPHKKESYINEHSTSSLGGGYSWPAARAVTDAEWREYESRVKESLWAVVNHPGWGNTIEWHTGIRARTNELPGLVEHVENSEDRSRMILFSPEESALSVLMGEKQPWYQKVIERLTKTLQPSGELYFPMAEGYRSYIRAGELFKEYPFKAYDGRSWESIVGSILGPAFRSLLVCIKGWYMVPSGILWTTIFDSAAMMQAIATKKGPFIILGDDCSHWGTENLATPYLEYQPLDTKMKMFLGYGYWEPDQPRISGIKATSESSALKQRAELTLDPTLWPGPEVGEGEDLGWMLGRHSPQEIVVNAGLYLGLLKDGTTMDVLTKMPGEVTAPWLSTERIVQQAVTGHGDVFAWAEREGVRHLFE